MSSRPLPLAAALLLLAGPALAGTAPGTGACPDGPHPTARHLMTEPATPREATPAPLQEWPGLITIPYCRSTPVGPQPPRSLDAAVTPRSPEAAIPPRSPEAAIPPRGGQIVLDEGAHQRLQAL